MKEIISQFISEVNARNKNEPEFMQAVTEVAENVIPYIVQNDIYYGQNIFIVTENMIINIVNNIKIFQIFKVCHLGLMVNF